MAEKSKNTQYISSARAAQGAVHHRHLRRQRPLPRPSRAPLRAPEYRCRDGREAGDEVRSSLPRRRAHEGNREPASQRRAAAATAAGNRIKRAEEAFVVALLEMIAR